MYVLTIYNFFDGDIEIKWQQAAPDQPLLQRAALRWAAPFGIVEPETTSGMDEDQQLSFVDHLAPADVARLFNELHSYLNDGAGADDPRIMLCKADG